jgi:hypothetical protein
MVELTRAELVTHERKDIVRIRIASEHRLLEDELAVEVDVEDPVGAGHDLDRLDAVLPLLEQSRRQTGGVRERASGDAVLDPDVVPVSHEGILADSDGQPAVCESAQRRFDLRERDETKAASRACVVRVRDS